MAVEEEWEVPVGLTAEHAIVVDSSSDDDHDVTTCIDHPSKYDEAAETNENVTIDKTGRGSSYFKSSTMAAQEADVGGTCAQVTTNNVDASPKNNDEVKPSLLKSSEESVEQNNCNDNPFAAFAFDVKEDPTSTLPSWQSRKKRALPMLNTSSSVDAKSKKCKQNNKQVNHTSKQNSNKKSWSIAELQTKTGGEEQLEKEEHRRELIQKWHSFSDPDAPIEVRRFQVLTAARIHARCQEPIVRKAMTKLREYFAEKDTTDNGIVQSLSAQCLAQCDAENDIAPLLSSVLFGNVKAQHIVQAAKDVLNMFRGQVPEEMASLTNITGIGPKLSQILNIVNRRDTYASKSECT